jgi:hypothetical protein
MTPGFQDVVRRMVDDLRREADARNARSTGRGVSPELRRSLRSQYEFLRMLANRYEGWISDLADAPEGAAGAADEDRTTEADG